MNLRDKTELLLRIARIYEELRHIESVIEDQPIDVPRKRVRKPKDAVNKEKALGPDLSEGGTR